MSILKQYRVHILFSLLYQAYTHSASVKSCMSLMSAIPWADIMESSNKYYDTTTYMFPTSIKSSDHLKVTPLAIYGVYDYLLSIFTSDSFWFQPALESKSLMDKISSIDECNIPILYFNQSDTSILPVPVTATIQVPLFYLTILWHPPCHLTMSQLFQLCPLYL